LLKIASFLVKAYIRKGTALLAMHEYSRAQKAYEEALEIDPSNREAMDGLYSCTKNNDLSSEKSREQALQDPEIQKILG
jgi:Tfp pilus assembly protein PilF